MRRKNLLIAAGVIAICAASAAKAETTSVNFLTGAGSPTVSTLDPTNIAGVTFSGPAYAAGNSAGWLAAPDTGGTGFGIIQSVNGTAGSITLDTSSITSGVFTLSFGIQQAFWGYFPPEDPITVSYGSALLGVFTTWNSFQWDMTTLNDIAANGSDITFTGQSVTSAPYADTGLGYVTVVSSNGGGIGEASSATPELSTPLMMALAGLGLGFLGWRRRELTA
jgi:uncharacterized protein (TIGR03382 family)